MVDGNWWGLLFVLSPWILLALYWGSPWLYYTYQIRRYQNAVDYWLGISRHISDDALPYYKQGDFQTYDERMKAFEACWGRIGDLEYRKRMYKRKRDGYDG